MKKFLSLLAKLKKEKRKRRQKISMKLNYSWTTSINFLLLEQCLCLGNVWGKNASLWNPCTQSLLSEIRSSDLIWKGCTPKEEGKWWDGWRRRVESVDANVYHEQKSLYFLISVSLFVIFCSVPIFCCYNCVPSCVTGPTVLWNLAGFSYFTWQVFMYSPSLVSLVLFWFCYVLIFSLSLKQIHIAFCILAAVAPPIIFKGKSLTLVS